MRFPTALVAVVVAVLAAAAPASAGTLISTGPESISFFAGKGEANDMVVSWSADRVVFADNGATFETAPDSCGGQGTHVVTCPPVGGIAIQLYDSSDANADKRLRIDTAPGFVPDSPSGNYFIAGGGGDDQIDLSRMMASGAVYGGDGDDLMTGSAGRFSLLSGDTGDDIVRSGGAAQTTFDTRMRGDGADTYVGGAGVDIINYTLRGGPVHVTPSHGADDGEAGERDNVGAVERVITWIGADRIRTASAVGLQLDAGPGDDVLVGGPGDDVLSPGYGVVPGSHERLGDADILRGGPGRDTVSYNARSIGTTYPVVVSQNGRADDGYAGEHDNIADDIEVIEGARLDDNIVGGPAANTLRGFNGQDKIYARGGGRDVVDCGRGYDLAVVDASDRVIDCEVVRTG